MTDNDPLFFNYQEFSITSYEPLNSESQAGLPLVVTHFPNVYVPVDSEIYRETRIVRVCREFSTQPDYVTQFSTYLPGTEPGAIGDDGTVGGPVDSTRFVPRGVFSGQLFGYSSVSPLGLYLSESEFRGIVSEINELLYKAAELPSPGSIASNVVGFLTGWLSDYLFSRSGKKKLYELEELVVRINKEKLLPLGIEIISPRRSGYLSLDFQIPRPKLSESEKPVEPVHNSGDTETVSQLTEKPADEL